MDKKDRDNYANINNPTAETQKKADENHGNRPDPNHSDFKGQKNRHK